MITGIIKINVKLLKQKLILLLTIKIGRSFRQSEAVISNGEMTEVQKLQYTKVFEKIFGQFLTSLQTADLNISTSCVIRKKDSTAIFYYTCYSFPRKPKAILRSKTRVPSTAPSSTAMNDLFCLTLCREIASRDAKMFGTLIT